VLPIQLLVEVFPLRVSFVDQRKLPHAWPMLQVLLALQGVANVIVWFVVDKAFQTVALGEAVVPSRCSQTRRERLLVTPT
jgi:hypothetical protein